MEAFQDIPQIAGWKIANSKAEDGMLFLRRETPLTNYAMRRIFRDAIVFAYRHDRWVSFVDAQAQFDGLGMTG
jgi:hypothetical protein